MPGHASYSSHVLTCSRQPLSARQPVTADWKVSGLIPESAGFSTAEEGWAQQNYRPISNWLTMSKVHERLVLARMWPHMLSCANFSQFQSAYRKGHSTETALLEVLDGVFTAADDKQVTVLMGLDL